MAGERARARETNECVSFRHYWRFSLVILCSNKWITGLLSRQARKHIRVFSITRHRKHGTETMRNEYSVAAPSTQRARTHIEQPRTHAHQVLPFSLDCCRFLLVFVVVPFVVSYCYCTIYRCFVGFIFPCTRRLCSCIFILNGSASNVLFIFIWDAWVLSELSVMHTHTYICSEFNHFIPMHKRIMMFVRESRDANTYMRKTIHNLDSVSGNLYGVRCRDGTACSWSGTSRTQ